MSALESAPQDLTKDEAQAFVRHVRASVEEIGAWIVRAVKGRAWIALGYASWDEMCEGEFDGAVIRLPREDRREAVASLREAGLSTRAIAGALGVDAKTVRNDAASTGEKSPVDTVTSLDGRSRPAARLTKTVQVVDADTGEVSEVTYEDPAKAIAANRRFTAERYVEEFPELVYYFELDRIGDVVRLGHALRGYAEPERTMRRQNLRKRIAADRRQAAQPPAPEPEPDWHDLASRMFFAANEAAKVIGRSGGPNAFANAIAGADPVDVENWHGQFAELSAACAAIAGACKPKLRRIK